MDIKQQTKLAKKFTQDLAELIVNSNKKLNKNNEGCSVSLIDIHYYSDRTIVSVKFNSNDEPVKSFVCSATVLCQ